MLWLYQGFEVKFALDVQIFYCITDQSADFFLLNMPTETESIYNQDFL